MNRWFRHGNAWPLREGEPSGGGGDPKVDIEATVRRLLKDKGGEDAIGELLRDNFQQREQIRTLKAQVEELDGKVPAGGIVLDAAQAAAWKKYQELGKPDDLERDLQTKVELEGKEKRRERESRIAEAATALEYKPEVLQRMPGVDDLRFELKDEVVNGETVKVPYVTPAGDGATPVKLEAYVEEHWKEFLPALEATDGGDDGEPAREPAPTRRMPPQRPTGSRGKSGPKDTDKIIEEKRAAGAYSM